MTFGSETPAALDAALTAARRGEPTLLFVRGAAGFGKSTLLSEVRSRASDFAVVGTVATETDQEPFATVARLGVTAERLAGGRYPAGIVVAQRLGEMLESLGPRPVLLWVDDLQWADPESVDVLQRLFERAAGTALLVAVATRPAGHPGLDDWADRTAGVRRVELTGLSFAAAADLVRRTRPGLDHTTVRTLLEHTGGNPLYFTTLLAELDDLQLHRGQVLPAPAAFARSVVTRMRRCGPQATALLQAVSVLGAAGAVSVYDAADVAGGDDTVPDPDAAAQALLDAELVVTREIDGITELEAAHSLVRSAVYQSLSLPDRRRLHQRAAAVAPTPALALEHRASAVSRYDDDVARALAEAAWAVYRGGSPRRGARLLRWASSLTRDPVVRENRRLDAVFVAMMGRDVAARTRDLATVGPPGDGPRQAAVRGLQALLAGAPADAVAILEPAVRRWPVDPDVDVADATEAGEQAVRSRLATLLAWARVGDGNSLDFLNDLAAAAARGVVDPPLIEVIGFAQGLARVRATGAEAELDRLAGLPRDPAAFGPELSFVLGWRGLLSMVLGIFDDSLADQQEMLARVRAGTAADSSSGGILPYLATALWSVGEWDLARVYFRIAADAGAAQVVGPLLALFALEPAGRGHTAAADEWIARAMLSAEHWNWPEIGQNILMARVVREHTVGTPAERAKLWPDMVRRFPGPMRGTGLTGAPWLTYGTLAAVWAGELGDAEGFVERMRTGSPRPSWTAPVALWLTALIAEARGDLAAALAACEAAVRHAERPPRMHRLWMVTDLLRLRSLAGVAEDRDELEAERARLRQQLGVVEEALQSVGPGPGLPPERSRPAPPVRETSVGGAGFGLSDRERDVATLVAAGLSYQQIAQELFITRSTVGFHLGKIYAKAGVATRHELTALLRTDPAAFGLAAPAR